MAGLCRLLLVSGALCALSVSAAQTSVFSLDIHPYSGPHEDGRRLRKRSTVLETLSSQLTLYTANVTIGTPPQNQSLQITINASDTWVLASNSTACTQNGSTCDTTGSYNANSSSSYDYLNSDFAISFADGSSSTGDYITETLSIGNGTLPGQQIAVVYNSTDITLGILGLGFTTQEIQFIDNGAQQYSNLPESMANEGIINTNAYSLWLNDLYASTGSILFGGVDTEKYDGELMTIPLVTRPANTSDLLVQLSGVRFGNNNILHDGDLTVSLDTGTTFMYLPSNITSAFYNLTGTSYDSNLGAAVIDCNQSTNDTVLEITLSDWVVLNVTMRELVVQSTTTNGAEVCVLGISPSNGDFTILGLTFLRSQYVVYDLSNQEISIAPAKFNVTASNIVEIQNGVNGVPGAIRTPTATSSGTSSTSTTASSSSSSSASSSHGLSAGASAGIGVGVAVGAIAIIAGLFLLWRRRRKTKRTDTTTDSNHEYSAVKQELPADPVQRPNLAGEAHEKRTSELPTGADGVHGATKPVEVAGSEPTIHELG